LSARFFKDDGFQFATEIALGSVAYGAAEVGEVLAVVAQVKSGDYDSWCDAWLAAGERVAAVAEDCEAKGHRRSAFEAWLRASNYFDRGSFYMLGTRDPHRFVPTWRRHRDCFERAAALHDPPWEKVEIPFEDTRLEGYVFRPPGADGARPLLILNNGADATVLRMWVMGGAAAIDRGYVCLTFDGPGQGQALHEQGLFFRANWESVITPVVDFALGLPGVDPDRIAVQGISQGGYWVPRAVAYEQRIAAAIADPGIVDVSTVMTDHLPKRLRKQLEEGEREKFNRLMRWGERFSKEVRFNVDFRGRPYGAETLFDMLHDALSFKLEPEVIARIRCPMLITDPDNEQFWPGQSQRLYDALECPKQLVRFTAAEGADSHCEPRTPVLRNQRVLDWLDETL
jgi:alpha-beta hydrolase superfamily lysophospholipase